VICPDYRDAKEYHQAETEGEGECEVRSSCDAMALERLMYTNEVFAYVIVLNINNQGER
jgi:hypothetical protein